MKALLELAASILQRAKEKGFDILLLLAIVAALAFYIQYDNKVQSAVRVEMRAEMKAISQDLTTCNNAREKMAVEVARLSIRIEWLEDKAKRR